MGFNSGFKGLSYVNNSNYLEKSWYFNSNIFKHVILIINCVALNNDLSMQKT